MTVSWPTMDKRETDRARLKPEQPWVGDPAVQEQSFPHPQVLSLLPTIPRLWLMDKEGHNHSFMHSQYKKLALDDWTSNV